MVLFAYLTGLSQSEIQHDKGFWDHWVESAIQVQSIIETFGSSNKSASVSLKNYDFFSPLYF